MFWRQVSTLSSSSSFFAFISHQPLNNNIISWVKLLQTSMQLVLHAAGNEWCGALSVVCHMDTCQLFQSPTFCGRMRSRPWWLSSLETVDQHRPQQSFTFAFVFIFMQVSHRAYMATIWIKYHVDAWRLRYGDGAGNTMENCSIISLVWMRWLPSARSCRQ